MRYVNARTIPLYKEICIIPLTKDLFDEMNQFKTSESIGKFELLNKRLFDILEVISESRIIAYVEAEYFGGVGGQGVIVWDNHEVLLFEQFANDAINKALKLLGVKCDKDKDEFDTVGLGRHRNTVDWLEEVN